MQNKKGFTLIELMIVVAIIAILAMIAVPMYQRYIERSRNSATQSLLQQLALAQVGRNTDDQRVDSLGNYIYTTDALPGIEALASYGFRPDRNVGFSMEEPTVTVNGATATGFVIYGAHKAIGSSTYVYDNILHSGVTLYVTGETYGNGTTIPGTYNIYGQDNAGAMEAAGTLTISADGKVTAYTP